MTIRKFHKNNNQENRETYILIPNSAHGTNPASAQMSGMKVVVINCDNDGNVDLDDLKIKQKNTQRSSSFNGYLSINTWCVRRKNYRYM